MKTVVDFNITYKFKGAEYHVTRFSTIDYDEPMEKEIVLDTFDKAYDFINEGRLLNSYTSIGAFTKRKKLYLSCTEKDFGMVVTEKNFSPITVKYSKTPVKKYSIKDLADSLTADEFCEYLKDKGINSLPQIN